MIGVDLSVGGEVRVVRDEGPIPALVRPRREFPQGVYPRPFAYRVLVMNAAAGGHQQVFRATDLLLDLDRLDG